MTDVIAREIVNFSWAVFCLAILIILGRRLWREMQHDGFYAELGNKMAVGLWVYFFGELNYRTWIGALLWLIDQDTGPLHPRELYLVAFISAMIAMVGGLCIIRLMTQDRRERNPNWPWFLTYLAIAFTSAAVATIKL